MSLRRSTLVAGAVLIGIVAVAAGSGTAGRILDSRPAASAASTVTAAPPAALPTTAPPVVRSVFDTGVATPHDDDDGLWLSWSLADSAGDRRVGSANSSTERTNAESSMKAWITTDFLRIAGDRGRSVRASDRADIDAAIRRSDDEAAERLYRRSGADQVLRDLNSVCGVAVSTTKRGYWSSSQITAADATTILTASSTRASYPGGDEIVTDLRSVEPDDAFGIPQALPAGTTFAVKNGWTAHAATGKWNVNCVAAWDHYTLAVMVRYPIARKLDYGAGVCRDVTTTLSPASTERRGWPGYAHRQRVCCPSGPAPLPFGRLRLLPSGGRRRV